MLGPIPRALTHTLIVISFATGVSSCSGDAPLSASETQRDGGGGDDDDSFAGRSDGGTPDAGPPAEDLDWEPCPAHTGEEGDGARCVTLEMPLRHESPGVELSKDSESIDFFIKKFPAKAQVKSQLWLLQGGPGFAGVALEGYAEYIQERLDGVEVYIPDHRGTKRSTWFECEDIRASLDAEEIDFSEYMGTCPEELTERWGDNYSTFGPTQAALDVANAIRRTRRDDVPVTVYGGSYGTFWLHRLLQVNDDLVDSAIFDSPTAMTGGVSMAEWLLHPVAAGQALFEHCKEDPDCAEHFGDDPMQAALEYMEAGTTCLVVQRTGIDRDILQHVLTAGLDRYSYRRLLPAVLFRLARCEPGDIEFFVGYAESLLAPREGDDQDSPLMTHALSPSIMLSEVYTKGTELEDLVEQGRQVVFSHLAGLAQEYQGNVDWPRYEPDAWAFKWAKTESNVLILGGELDVRTPRYYAAEMADHFTEPNQYYVEVQRGSHGVLFGSHTISKDLPCGMHIALQFLENPTEQPEADCAADAPAFKVEADEELLLDIAGHTDVWDNPELVGIDDDFIPPSP